MPLFQNIVPVCRKVYYRGNEFSSKILHNDLIYELAFFVSGKSRSQLTGSKPDSTLYHIPNYAAVSLSDFSHVISLRRFLLHHFSNVSPSSFFKCFLYINVHKFLTVFLWVVFLDVSSNLSFRSK